MPRQKRIDIAGCLYHVIGRGIERRNIFKDDKDKEEYLKRLSDALESTKTMCYAWVLMDNHYHLLVRPLEGSLSTLMRKVLSGYVGYFNSRHKRVGHLFQNRYKSILCQEDSYFKELVRYIHLNPVRSKIIKSLPDLKAFQWCGHGALLGKKTICNQETDEVLSIFGNQRKDAQKSYLNFVKDGWFNPHNKEYSGGGLLRSAGANKGLQLLKKLKEKWQYDDRILGDGNFVESCLESYDAKEEIKMKLNNKYTLETLGELVCKKFEIKESELYSGRRLRRLSISKGVYAFLASQYLNITLKRVGVSLKISSTNSIYKLKEYGRKHIEEYGNFLISK